MEIVYKYFLAFLIYSFLGWLMEVCLSFFSKHKFINRGFLIGPYCPIYGWGALAIILIVGSSVSDMFGVFAKAVLVCATLEYFTSYFMEKIYNVRWWDYSTKRFNINGRICLEAIIPFGILSLLIIYVVHPFVLSILSGIPSVVLSILAIVLFVLFIIDNIVSTSILFKIKGMIKNERKDNTEKIRKYIEKWFQENTVFYRRLKSAFPKFQIFKKIK